MNIYKKITLRTEPLAYTLGVAPIAVFLVTSFRFAKMDMTFTFILIIAGIATSIAMGLIARKFFLAPINRVLVKNPTHEISNSDWEKAIVRAYKLPIMESAFVLLRWTVGALVMILIPMKLRFPDFNSEYTIYSLFILMTMLIQVPVFYFVSEGVLSPFFKLSEVRAVSDGMKLRTIIGLKIKFIYTVLIAIIYPVVVFISVIYLSMNNVASLETYIPGIITVLISVFSLSLIMLFMLINNIKMTLNSVNLGVEEMSNGNLKNDFPIFSKDEIAF